LVDEYLEFVAARARRETLLATALDLKVFLRLGGETAGGDHDPGCGCVRGRAALRFGEGGVDPGWRFGFVGSHGGPTFVEPVGV
jgi:hypothetical protein